jgi:alanyl-tRNA synthetase
VHERIYYTDPRCTDFRATVRRAFEHEGRPAVQLDRTAFYPTSGGQPHDLGTLDGVGVVDVLDDETGIIHVLSSPIAAGAEVHGEVERRRRLDHMQQHTGQHVLSAAFDRLFQNPTVSFHMGADVCTIDLARELSPADAEAGVTEANRIVFENRPVSIRIVSEEEAATLPLRKEPARQGPLRLIEVDDFDLSACGGTHVSRTGEIGAIVMLGAERVRGGSRVTFACGGRALRHFAIYRDAVAGTIRQLSVLPRELPGAVERLQNEARDLRKAAGRLQEALAVHEAARLLTTAADAGGARLLCAVLEGWDAQGLKAIAVSAVSGPGVAVALLAPSTPVAIVIARSKDVPIDAGKLLRELTAAFGGRGGGKPDLAQGGGMSGAPIDIVAAARAGFEKALATRG